MIVAMNLEFHVEITASLIITGEMCRRRRLPLCDRHRQRVGQAKQAILKNLGIFALSLNLRLDE